jgi:hypothetical protein
MPSFVLGFKAYADNHPEVGDPLEDEHDLGPDFRAQATSGGLLLYRKIENDVLFIPRERHVDPDPVRPQVAVHIQWIGSPNFSAGRAGTPVGLVLHTMAGSLAGCDSWFNNPASGVSAHFGVGLDGTVHQYVRLEDTAWANGRLESGERWSARFGRGNPNAVTVSIETEDRGNSLQPVTDLQFGGVLAAAQAALRRYPSITHLAGHHRISPETRSACPGSRWLASGRFAQLAESLGLKTLE